MAFDQLEAAVPDGEALRYNVALRTGGSVGLTDDRLLVVDEQVTSIELDTVVEVTVQSFDWFLGILSVVLVVIGFLATADSVLGGAAFVLVGLASLYRTYRNRGEVYVQVNRRAKPLKFYPVEVEAFQKAMGRVM